MVITERFTDFNRTLPELEELIMFSVAVAGKNAANISRALDVFFRGLDANDIEPAPFAYADLLARKGKLRKELERARLGKYTLLTKSWAQLFHSGIDLKTCSIDELESIHGIGPKTARMFVLHSRPDIRVAVLDVHILKYMREELGLIVPRSTPGGRKYLEIEKQFLTHCDNMEIENIAEFDLALWERYRTKSNKGNSDNFF